MGTVVLDTEALTGFARNQVLRAAIELLVERGWDVMMPAVILSEAMSGRPQDDVTTQRTINRLGTVVTEEDTAHYAGILRARIYRGKRAAPSGIDALVAAHAALLEDDAVVFTSDPKDLAALVAEHPRVRVRPVP